MDRGYSFGETYSEAREAGDIERRLEEKGVDYISTDEELQQAIETDERYVTINDLLGREGLNIQENPFFQGGTLERSWAYTIEGTGTTEINGEEHKVVEVEYTTGEEDLFFKSDIGLGSYENTTQRIAPFEEIAETDIKP